ncbi:pilus assembly protein CpaB [Serratia sp. NPDC078593]|uniref:pilus assembly protein CpaB n=1 Tax=unclassified Serratia (in: enterobacteria) TaxID=2647522 RepID=UPI0037D23C28
MNHRVLFVLSVTVIVIGLAGIIMQGRHSDDTDSVKTAVSSSVKTKSITIAEALRDLSPHDIIEVKDYRLRTIEIAQDRQDERDIRAMGSSDLNGFLVRNHIAKNSAIIAQSVESPTSKTFLLHSLKKNELPYGYLVRPQEEYLLSSLSIGDKVALYIRIAESNKNNGANDGGMTEGSGSSTGSANKKYALSRVTGPLSILDIQREGKKEEVRTFDTEKEVGKIVLRMNQKQLADLRVVEKTGEILLFPAEDGMGNKQKIKMDEVLPQFKTIKELRGEQ